MGGEWKYPPPAAYTVGILQDRGDLGDCAEGSDLRRGLWNKFPEVVVSTDKKGELEFMSGC